MAASVVTRAPLRGLHTPSPPARPGPPLGRAQSRPYSVTLRIHGVCLPASPTSFPLTLSPSRVAATALLPAQLSQLFPSSPPPTVCRPPHTPFLSLIPFSVSFPWWPFTLGLLGSHSSSLCPSPASCLGSSRLSQHVPPHEDPHEVAVPLFPAYTGRRLL